MPHDSVSETSREIHSSWEVGHFIKVKNQAINILQSQLHHPDASSNQTTWLIKL